MENDDIKKFYGLCSYLDKSPSNKNNIIHRSIFNEQLLEEAIDKGYVIEYGRNQLGEMLYITTEKGCKEILGLNM